MSKEKQVVIYVDDDLEDIDFVRQALKSYANDIELITFTDPFDLLKFIGTANKDRTFPCLMILDINMPGLDGKQTLKMLRQIEGYSATPVVLFSTSTLPSDAHFAQKYGAELITKPLTACQMNTIVKRFLEQCGEDIRNHAS